MKSKNTHLFVFVTNFFPFKGGLERYTEELFSRLAQGNDTITIICLTPNQNMVEEYRGMRVIRLRPLFHIAGVFALPRPGDWSQFKKMTAHDTIHVVSTQTRFFFTSYLGMRFARKRNIPLVHTERGSDFVQSSSKIISLGSRIYDETFGRAVLKRATSITAVSKDVQKFLKQWLNLDSTVINNGINTDFWDPRKNTELPPALKKIAADKIVFLYMGRLLEAKGWKILIQAAETLPSATRNKIAIFFAGDGPDRSNLEKAISQSSAQSALHYIGKQDPEVIRAILAKGTYLNPSYSAEGLQSTLLEAAAMNSWIITTPVAGTSEVINEHTGELIQKKSITSLSTSLQRFIENPIRARGRTRVATDFDWSTITQKYEKIINSLF